MRKTHQAVMVGWLRGKFPLPPAVPKVVPIWWGSSVSSRAVRNPSTARGGVCVPPQRGAKCDSNLVDSASSHTLVSKIKPCMSKYKRLYTVKLRTAH